MFLDRAAALLLAAVAAAAVGSGNGVSAECVGSETNICMTVDLFASETGYYNLDRGDYEDTPGPSPTITIKIGQTITFDQTDPTNWYHAVGFAYEPDGAHGDDWGSDENPEVEGAGELQYLIDDEIPGCDDAGDTGLDCYEPEFFYPRPDWMLKKYTAELTVTDDVAAASRDGVIYYFCHIHSKMSGKIQIVNEDGSPYSNGNGPEADLYEPVANDEFDEMCGTSDLSKYADGGESECGDVEFFPGPKDTDFTMCLQAVDCQMYYEMYSETSPYDPSSDDTDDKISMFMQQMIPHHLNAVNMAKLLLKQSTQEELDAVEDLEEILYSIINVQNFQIHQFRNYLNPDGQLLTGVTDVVPPLIERSEEYDEEYDDDDEIGDSDDDDEIGDSDDDVTVEHTDDKIYFEDENGSLTITETSVTFEDADGNSVTFTGEVTYDESTETFTLENDDGTLYMNEDGFLGVGEDGYFGAGWDDSYVAVVGVDQDTGAITVTDSDGNCLSIPDIVCLNDDYSYMCDIMKASLEDFDTSQDWDYTLFVPSNAAFDKIMDVLDGLDEETIDRVLLFHGTEGKVASSDMSCKGLVTMYDGSSSRTMCTQNGDGESIMIQKGGGNRRNDLLPHIVAADIEACNGYIHAIDNVMLPNYVPTF